MTESNKDSDQLVIRKSVFVNASQAHAFEVFTMKHSLWWPLQSHHIGNDPQSALIEPKVGGRWFERSKDGAECDWGRVLVWEPPSRIVLTWDISPDWKYHPHLGTEVEVRFIPESPNSTRVELEHRHLERYGAFGGKMKDIFDSDGGWGGILRGYVQVAEKI